MALRVALGNNKGGTGKSAGTVNLAAALAEAGKSVLVVDLDPQANSSRRLGFHLDQDNPVPTVSEVVQAGTEGVAADAITAAGWNAPYVDRIDLIPARFDLENRISEAAVLGAVSRLRRALEGVDDKYDVTLIDCPPSLGHLTQLGLAAAHIAVCAVEPEYDAVEGAVRFRDFVAGQADELKNPGLRIGGFIVNRVRAKLGAHAYQIDGLPDLFGAALVWEPYIPERAVIKDAGDAAVPLRVVGGSAANQVADIYAALAQRLLQESA